MPDPINPRTELAIDLAALPQDRREAVANLAIMFGVSVYAEVSSFLFQSKALIGDVNSSFTDADQQELALKQIDCTLRLYERLAKSQQDFSAAVDAAVNFGGTKQ